MSSRVKYLDYAKGFAIICMLLSHAIPQENDIIRTIISGFDMPLFFVVCGCIIAIKDKDDISFSGYLRKRIRTIFVPYVIFGVALSLFYCALSALSNNEIDLWYYLVRLLTFQGVESLWFLPVYFFAETLFVFIFKKFNSISRIIIFSFFVVSVCIFYNMFYIFEGSFILRFIIRILIAFIFVYIGFFILLLLLKLKRIVIYI